MTYFVSVFFRQERKWAFDPGVLQPQKLKKEEEEEEENNTEDLKTGIYFIHQNRTSWTVWCKQNCDVGKELYGASTVFKEIHKKSLQGSTGTLFNLLVSE